MSSHPTNKEIITSKQQLPFYKWSNLSSLLYIYKPKELKLSELSFVFLVFTAASLPFLFRLTTFFLLIFAFFSIWNAFKNPKPLERKKIFPALAFICYFLLYSISYFYSSDKSGSLQDLETKFSLFALPVLILFFNNINTTRLKFILISFLLGLFLFETISLLYATIFYLSESSSEYFFYHQLVSLSDANASYFSLYVLFSIVILLFHPHQIEKKILLPFLIFQVFYLLLLSSRSMQLILLLLVFPYAIHQHFKDGKRWVYASIASGYLLLLSIFFINPQMLNQRFGKLQKENLQQAFLPEYRHHSYEFSNWNTRLFFWRVGVDNIQESNFLVGVGNGDVNTVQNQRMHELGILNIYDQKQPSDFVNMNLHNMYLQTQLAVGIFGSLLLLSLLFIPLKIAWKHSNHAYILFQLLIIIFMMQESALQTQAGVVFYCFFSLIYLNHSTLITKKQND